MYYRKAERISVHLFVCVLSIPVSRILAERLLDRNIKMKNVTEILDNIAVIPIKYKFRVM